MIETNVGTVRRPTVEYLQRILADLDVPVGSGFEGGASRVPAATLYRLWDAAESESADTAIGLRAAARTRPSDFGVLGTVLEQAPTLGEALVELSRLQPLTSDSLRWVLVVNGARTTLELVVGEPNLLHPRSAEHIVAMVGFAVQSRLPRAGSFALAAHWSHPPPAPDVDYESVLGMAVRFDAGWNGLSFDTDALGVRRGGIQDDFETTRRRAEHGLRASPRPGLAIHVRDLIGVELNAGRPVSEEAVARQLGLHPKSLSRRLAARGTTFRREVEAERFDRARRLLEAGRPVGDVARSVGYADATAFSRAFKRWSGTTPTAYKGRMRRAGLRPPPPLHP